MPGQARLDGDLRGFQIADFSHHDHIRVLPQDGPQAAREGQALLLVDGNLQDARQLVLDGVFDRDDLLAAVQEKKPLTHIFGHIHGGRGMYAANDTIFYNASIVDETYKVAHDPWVITFEKEGK